MKKLFFLALVSLVNMLLLSCGAPSFTRSVENLSERIYISGASLLPPQGTDWFVMEQGPYAVAFGKLVRDQYKEPSDTNHTLVVLIAHINVSDESGIWPTKSKESFRALVEYLLIRQGTGRFKLLKHDIYPYTHRGNECLRYTAAYQEKENRLFTSETLILEDRGLFCRYPNPDDRFVWAQASERRPQHNETYISETIAGEINACFESIQMPSRP